MITHVILFLLIEPHLASINTNQQVTLATKAYSLPRGESCKNGEFYNGNFCTKCKPGTYTATWDAESCISCPDGYFNSLDGSSQCYFCEMGKVGLNGRACNNAPGLLCLLSGIVVALIMVMSWKRWTKYTETKWVGGLTGVMCFIAVMYGGVSLGISTSIIGGFIVFALTWVLFIIVVIIVRQKNAISERRSWYTL
eukprot:c5642_g1_i1.p1 GENE.c5642_g1_i1~~c5642_g1_i1.p1  ORF type:complete len:196 (-),score=22.15 c5642_g1_i1:18-605(-)